MSAATIMLVDDDRDVRESMELLLRPTGHQVRAYATPHELLDDYQPQRPGCLIIDLKMPLMNGIELYRTLQQRGCVHPFIMITAHGDVHAAVEAMRDGAVDFFEKPFDHQRLLQRVEEAVTGDADYRDLLAESARVEMLLQSLTNRERQVMDLVVQGRLTKQIAKDLGISSKTVEVHRSHVTRKMQVQSVAQLVQLITHYQVHGQPVRRRPVGLPTPSSGGTWLNSANAADLSN